jgi:hypothetical protein
MTPDAVLANTAFKSAARGNVTESHTQGGAISHTRQRRLIPCLQTPNAGFNQGLKLVHFSAQPEPFLTLKTLP